MKVNWREKLSSRKFWAAVAGFVTPLLAALGAEPGTAEKIVAIIMAGAALIAYIIGEGLVDAARQNAEGGGKEE